MGAPEKVSAAVWRAHLILLLKTAWPNLITFTIGLLIPVASTLFVGHIGSSELIGAAALGNMFGNASGFAVGTGLSMALDTLCSQAFGAKRYKLVGLHTQRAMVILSIVCVPISLLWYNSYLILQFIGDRETARLSQHWLRILMFGMWPRMMYEAYRRYLVGQRILWPMTVAVVMVVPVHMLNTYLLVFRFELGFDGAAWAVASSYWLLFSSLVAVNALRVWRLRRQLRRGEHAYTRPTALNQKVKDGESEEEQQMVEEEFDDIEENGDPLHTWPAWSMDVFRGWPAFLKLGVATTLSLVIEWGSFEVNAVIAANLGKVPLASHAILSNLAAIWYAPPNGLAGATTALVGNMLGAGEPERAWIFTRIAYVVNFIFCILNGFVGMFYKHYIGKAFTNDMAVVTLLEQMLPVLWIYNIFDSMKAVGMAVLRGSGRPVITVYGNIVSCILIGYPIAAGLVFGADLGLPGLWLGMASAWLVASTLYGLVIKRTDWSLEVEKAAQRNAEALLSSKGSGKGAGKSLGKGSGRKAVLLTPIAVTIIASATKEEDDKEEKTYRLEAPGSPLISEIEERMHEEQAVLNTHRSVDENENENEGATLLNSASAVRW